MFCALILLFIESILYRRKFHNFLLMNLLFHYFSPIYEAYFVEFKFEGI